MFSGTCAFGQLENAMNYWHHFCLESVDILFFSLQQKLKEEREAKRAHLDERHFYILQTVADSLGLELTEVEDAILEGNQVRYGVPQSHAKNLWQ